MTRQATWVFDIDGCLIDSLTGTSLRPGALELPAHLREEGCRVFLWSAGGADYARQRADEQSIATFVHGFFDKDGRDQNGRYLTDGLLPTLDRVVFVDDRPEDLPIGADFIAVPPYLIGDDHDRGLAPASRLAGIRVRPGIEPSEHGTEGQPDP